jgi:cyclophilin family peptidyl-prolyl cis-trans isomerase
VAQRSSIRRSAILSGALVAVLGVGVSAAAYKFRDATPVAVSPETKIIATSDQTGESTVADGTTAASSSELGSVTETTLPTLGADNSVPPLAALDTVTGSTLVGTAGSSTTTVAPVTTVPPSPVPGTSPCAPLNGDGERMTQFASAPAQCLDPKASYSAIITTKQGEIRIVLNARDTPVAVNAFVFLARHKFYDGLTFHRIVPGFIVQGGDPQANGSGGPGFSFTDELPAVAGYPLGSVAMANSGPGTNGSQFFIVSGDLGLQLPPSFTLFGRVNRGVDAVKAIDALGKAPTAEGVEFPPTEVVTIDKIRIVAVNERKARIPALNPDAVSTTTIAP